MATILKDSQEAAVAVEFVSKAGNPAIVDGVPTWGSSDPTIVEVVEVSEDGTSAKVRAVGPVGSAQVSVTGDADLGEGVRPVGATEQFDVVAGEAFSSKISVGEPTEKP